MKAQIVIMRAPQTQREMLTESAIIAEATAENMRHDLDTLEAGYCDHGATCEGTAHEVDCSSCYQFTYNGMTRDLFDAAPEPFTCEASDLLAAIKRVKLGVSRKSQLPVLSGVKINNGALTTTDMDVTVETRVKGSGSVSIVSPVAVLEKCIAKLSGVVTLDTDGLDLHVSAGSRAYTVKSFDAVDFPQTVPTSCPVLYGAPSWRTAWDKVRRAIGKDATRPILTTVSVDGREVVTCDSTRLAKYTLPGDVHNQPLPKALVAGRACEIVAKLKGDVSFGVTKGDTFACPACHGTGTNYNGEPCGPCDAAGKVPAQGTPAFNIKTADHETQVYARPVTGDYPNVNQLIPDPANMQTAMVDKRAIMGALDAVSVMATKNAPVRLSFNGKLTLSTTGQGVGTASETITYAGELGQYEPAFVSEYPHLAEAMPADPFTIGLNPDYLADGLACIDSAVVTMDVSGPLRPTVLHDEDPLFLYLLMPVRLGS